MLSRNTFSGNWIQEFQRSSLCKWYVILDLHDIVKAWQKQGRAVNMKIILPVSYFFTVKCAV